MPKISGIVRVNKCHRVADLISNERIRQKTKLVDMLLRRYLSIQQSFDIPSEVVVIGEK